MNRQRMLVGTILVGSFVLGCTVGGVVVFFRTVPPMAEILALGKLSDSGNQAYVRYRYGSYPVAKAALLQHADQLTSVGVGEGMLGQTGADFDLGLTYGRLAMAAERAGQAEDAALYMNLATRALAKRGQLVDDSQVRMSVERLDAAWDQRLGGAAEQTR